jgi:hypothetical protein
MPINASELMNQGVNIIMPNASVEAIALPTQERLNLLP